MNKAYDILTKAEKYNNSSDLLFDVYRIKSDEIFDSFVMSTSWTPEKIFKNRNVKIECRQKGTYSSSYSIKYDNISLGWLQTASGASNIIDSAIMLAKNNVKKVIFVGAVGALKKDIKLGEIATPTESYSFEGSSLYLYDKPDVQYWGRTIAPKNDVFIENVIKNASLNNIKITKRKVFSVDSIICEYSHLDFIKNTGAELIEMETAAFYKCMNMMNKNGIALLCVSDNSAANISLTSKTDEERETFYRSREDNIPNLIKIVCES